MQPRPPRLTARGSAHEKSRASAFALHAVHTPVRPAVLLAVVVLALSSGTSRGAADPVTRAHGETTRGTSPWHVGRSRYAALRKGLCPSGTEATRRRSRKSARRRDRTPRSRHSVRGVRGPARARRDRRQGTGGSPAPAGSRDSSRARVRAHGCRLRGVGRDGVQKTSSICVGSLRSHSDQTLRGPHTANGHVPRRRPRVVSPCARVTGLLRPREPLPEDNARTTTASKTASRTGV